MTLKRLLLTASSSLLLFSINLKGVLANDNPPPIHAPHALVLDLKTQEILFEKAADEKTSIASLTKLMVALLVLEEENLDEVVSISWNAANTIGSTAWLYAGEHFYVNDLLMALLIPSGNDAAVAFAEHISGTTTGFLKQMNAKSKVLGMNDTYFGNVTGLDASAGYSTARDLSKLTQILLGFERFREIIQTPMAELNSLEGTSRNIQNTNELLGQTISGLKVIGMKTGTTPSSGQSLIILTQDEAKNEGLIILLNSSDRYGDATHLLSWIGENFELGKRTDPKVILDNWPFADLNSYTPEFFDTMVNLKHQGIVQGDSETGFIRGGDSLNRAEMVTLLLRAAGYDEKSLQNCTQNTEKNYADVEKNLWYTQAIECATRLGWIEGDNLPVDTPPETLPNFRPSDPVTIAEGLKMIALATKQTPVSINETTWYQPYLDLFSSKGDIEMNENHEFFISKIAYSIGKTDDKMNRNTAFELIQRSLFSESKSLINVDEYHNFGAVMEKKGEELLISDPNLHFTLSGIPMGDYKLSDLKVEIQNPSGFRNDYYTIWRLVYGKTSQKGIQVNQSLFDLIIYDSDYLEAGFQPFENSERREENHYTELRCNQNLSNYDPTLVTLYSQLCPEGKISDQVVLNEG